MKRWWSLWPISASFWLGCILKDIDAYVCLFVASWASLPVHQHSGDSDVHKWHWHPHSGSIPAVLCSKIVRINTLQWNSYACNALTKNIYLCVDCYSMRYYRIKCNKSVIYKEENNTADITHKYERFYLIYKTGVLSWLWLNYIIFDSKGQNVG